MPDVDTAPASAANAVPDVVVTATPDNIPLNTPPVSPSAPNPPSATSPSALDTPTPVTPQRTQAIVQPQPAPEPGSFFKHLGNSFAGAVLGALAGKDTVEYVPDLDPKSPTYGQSKAVGSPKPARQQLRTIAQNALMGLAAGSQEKNGWAGAGAGVNAVMQQNRQDDLLKRKQAQEQFEQQQQGMLAKYAYAKFNAANVQNAMEMYNKGLEPDIAETNQIKDAANNANIPTEEMSWQQYLERAKTEPMWAVSHSAHPLGMRPTVDPVSGKPLTDAEGNQQAQPWVLTVQGNRDKNIEVPPIIAAKAQKWGKLGKLPTVTSGYEGITPNLSMPQDDFVRLMTDIKANETAASQAKLEDRYIDGKHFFHNPINMENTEAPETPETPLQAAQRKEADAGASLRGEQGKLIPSEIEKNRAQAEKDRKQAETIGDNLVAAYDPVSKTQIVTTGTEAANRNLQEVRKITSKQIDGYNADHTRLNDVQRKINAVVSTLPALDQGATQSVIIAKALADNKQHTMDELFVKTALKGASEQTRNFVQAVLSARESLMSMNKIITDSSRPNATQIKALLQTLPGSTTPDSRYGMAQLRRGQVDINSYRQKTPITQAVPAILPDPLILQDGMQQTQTPSAQAPPVNLLKEGVNTTFGNGQTWTLRNGVQTQVAGQ